MSINSNALVEQGGPAYRQSGDPRLADYYPAWFDNLADDVTVEGSMLDGAVQGADAVHDVVATIRTLYGDTQQFHFAGPWSGDRWVEDYIAEIDGHPLGCVVLVTRNASGRTDRIVASYRPRSTLLLFSRKLGERLSEKPYGKRFAGAADG
jgi:hypothetical protein